MNKFARIALLATFATLAPSAFTQTPAATCGAPPAALTLSAPNIFSEQQEQWLGDAMADMLERRYRPVNDPAESAYLERIGNRLLVVLPPTTLQFHFLMVDAPEINGFSMAGGRVYITRKLVANARSEDEVAGVIAHEIGHILTHQFAIETTADLKRLMNVTQVGDRDDVYAKFQRLVDLRSREKTHRTLDADDKQDQADRVAVYAAATAGYRPLAYPELWDRSFFVGGKIGSGWSDFFGITRPTEKRLRLMRQMAVTLPSGCVKESKADAQSFARWHELVLQNQKGEAAEATPVTSQVKLQPQLRMGLDRLRFSPDGKYLLAQDAASVIVLSRQPFQQVFHFDAEDANEASFSPASDAITFSTPALHVERWSIANKALSAAHEMNIPRTCVDTMLSPDGRTMVCVRIGEPGVNGFYLGLHLFDVDSSAELYKQNTWFRPTYTALFTLAMQQGLGLNSRLIPRSLSPDGNTLLIGPSDSKLAFDLRTRSPIKVSGALNGSVDGTYAFLDANTVAGLVPDKLTNSGLFSFPDGRLLKKVDLRFSSMESVNSGHHVLAHNLKDYRTAIADLDRGVLIGANKNGPMSIWNDTVAAESGDGSLLLMTATDKGLVAAGTQTLPISPLGRAQTVQLSPDGRLLAFSTRTRGAIWDVSTGKQLLLLKGFRGAYWNGRTFYGAFKDDDKETSHVFAMDFDTGHGKNLPFSLEKNTSYLVGHPLEWKSDNNKSTLTVHGREDNSILWTHEFAGDVPGWTINPTDNDILIALPLNRAGDILKSSSSLQAQALAVKYKDSGYVIQALSGTNGKVKDQLVVETPAAFDDANGFDRVGNLLYLSLSDNRVVVYNMAGGAQLRQMFGSFLAADAATGRVCTVNRGDELTVYTNTGQQLTHIRAGNTVRYAALRNNATELVVLTADQTIKRYAITAAANATAAAAKVEALNHSIGR